MQSSNKTSFVLITDQSYFDRAKQTIHDFKQNFLKVSTFIIIISLL